MYTEIPMHFMKLCLIKIDLEISEKQWINVLGSDKSKIHLFVTDRKQFVEIPQIMFRNTEKELLKVDMS